MSGPVTVKPRNDFRIIQIWLNIARYLAFAPLTVLKKSPRNTSQNNLLPTIYPVFFFLVYLGGTIFSFYERHYLYKKFNNISRIILDALQGVTEWMFIELVVLWCILRRHQWRRLVKSIVQFEHKVTLKFEGPVKDSNWRGLTVKIVLYHLVYVTTHVYDSIVNWTNASYSLAFVIFRFTTYYIMFSTLFVTFFCTWLKNRYLFLEQFLKESVVHNKFKFVVSEKEPTSVFYDRDRVREFSHNYQNLYLIVQEFNAIFGYQIFFICIATVLEILNAVNYGIPITKNVTININNSCVNTLYSTLYVICTTRIVMACDSVEKCGMKLRITCLFLYENSEKLELKEELYRLGNYVHGLCPKFSAAGFWHVNQGVLSTLFSSVMTYLIIIIQFNITLGQ